jgi:hypothetical protein
VLRLSLDCREQVRSTLPVSPLVLQCEASLSVMLHSIFVYFPIYSVTISSHFQLFIVPVQHSYSFSAIPTHLTRLSGYHIALDCHMFISSFSYLCHWTIVITYLDSHHMTHSHSLVYKLSSCDVFPSVLLNSDPSATSHAQLSPHIELEA